MSNLQVGTVIYEWVNEYETPVSIYTTSIDNLQANNSIYDIYGQEIGSVRYSEYSSPYIDLYTLIDSHEAYYERTMDDSTSTTVQVKINYISQLSDGTNTYTIKDAEARNSLIGKQDTLVSGTNIKTINNNSILGSGNISVETSIDNTTITKNGSNNLQSVATIDNRSGNAIKTWTGTRAQYDAIITKDQNTLYNIIDDTDVTSTVLEALYPVGAIYIGTMEVCPLTVLGIGTWAKVSEGRVLQGSDTGHNAGTTIEAGLPNITGSFTNENTAEVGDTGAFYKDSASRRNGRSGNDNYNDWNYFDASRSNPIYGNSDTVQPPAYCVNIWKRTT